MTSDQQLVLDTMLFVDTCSVKYEDFLAVTFETQLANQTNQVIIKEKTNITRNQLTLANYFYRLKEVKNHQLSRWICTNSWEM